jgi:hypothetical protein
VIWELSTYANRIRFGHTSFESHKVRENRVCRTQQCGIVHKVQSEYSTRLVQLVHYSPNHTNLIMNAGECQIDCIAPANCDRKRAHHRHIDPPLAVPPLSRTATPIVATVCLVLAVKSGAPFTALAWTVTVRERIYPRRR